MKKLSRREFPGKSAIGIGSAVLASQLPFELNAAKVPDSLNISIGFQ
jgi:hypothetical protein